MKNVVLSTIKKQGLINSGETLVIGLSGGADSLALTRVLAQLKKELSIKLVAVHLNHGIRGEEAKRDATFSENVAKELGIEFRLIHEDVPSFAEAKGLSLEEAGRILRYEAFAKVAGEFGATKIAVAHHADDQVETVLFNLIRGSSVNGICGMDYSSKLQGHEELTIIRPLLSVGRQEIEKYLTQEGIAFWCIDSTNLSDDYSRNQLRNVIIPQLKSINNKASEHIACVSKDIREVENYIESQAYKEFMDRYSEGRLETMGLFDLPELLVKRVLYSYICTLSGRKKDIERVHVLSLLELLKAQSGRIVHLPYGVKVKKSYDALVQVNEETTCPREVISLLELGEKGHFIIGNLEFKVYSKPDSFEPPKRGESRCFDYDLLSAKTGELLYRTAEEGDYFNPFTDGRSKTLSRYFIDEKIEARDQVRVLAFGNHVVYIEGLRNDESFRVSESTAKIIEIRRLS